MLTNPRSIINIFKWPPLFADLFAADISSILKAQIADAIRNIFSFDIWQSVRQIRETYGFKSIYEIFQVANTKFARDMFSSSNHITNHIANCDLS